MPLLIPRRTWLAVSAAAALAPSALAPSAHGADRVGLAAACRAIEARTGGRLGVAVLRGATVSGWRAHERFPLCSTFKFLLAASCLSRAAGGALSLAETISVPRTGLPGASPVTAAHAGQALSLETLCAATVQHSDNGAANLLLARLGGPPAVTAYARTLGDAMTRLDHIEPLLNTQPGDDSDTTTPAAIAASMAALVLGTALPPAPRAMLTQWLRTADTGLNRLRAATPPGWTAADRTGTARDAPACTNDIAIFWPPAHKPAATPVIIAAYLTGTTAPYAECEAALAATGRAALRLA